jgi:hypothetical protein
MQSSHLPRDQERYEPVQYPRLMLHDYRNDIISPVDDRGVMTAEAPGFEGVYYDKVNPILSIEANHCGVAR